jgi:hypothetical protein
MAVLGGRSQRSGLARHTARGATCRATGTGRLAVEQFRGFQRCRCQSREPPVRSSPLDLPLRPECASPGTIASLRAEQRSRTLGGIVRVERHHRREGMPGRGRDPDNRAQWSAASEHWAHSSGTLPR